MREGRTVTLAGRKDRRRRVVGSRIQIISGLGESWTPLAPLFWSKKHVMAALVNGENSHAFVRPLTSADFYVIRRR